MNIRRKVRAEDSGSSNRPRSLRNDGSRLRERKPEQRTWHKFSVPWKAHPGDTVLLTRATSKNQYTVFFKTSNHVDCSGRMISTVFDEKTYAHVEASIYFLTSPFNPPPENITFL